MPTNIFRIFENALAFLIKQKQLQKIEKNRNNKRERERNSPVLAHLAYLADHWPAQPTTAVVLLAPVGQACGRRARTGRAPRHQLACLPPLLNATHWVPVTRPLLAY